MGLYFSYVDVQYLRPTEDCRLVFFQILRHGISAFDSVSKLSTEVRILAVKLFTSCIIISIRVYVELYRYRDIQLMS